jgi:hypothetical protein
MSTIPNLLSRSSGKNTTFMPLAEYKLGSITAEKPPKEYEIKNPNAEEGQQSMKYHRQYLVLNDLRYPGLNSPVFVSKGKLTIMKFVDDKKKVNWSCFFTLSKEEQKAVNDIMTDLYKILINYKDFYGVAPDDLEEGEDPNKIMMRIAKKKLSSIAKYPKDKNDKKKEDKSKEPFLSSKIRDDITECFFLCKLVNGKKQMESFDYHLMEKKTFEAARYIHIRDIYTSKEPSVQVFMKKITMLEPPTTSQSIDDEYDEFAQSMYNEVNDETVSNMAKYFQDLMVKGSSSSAGPSSKKEGEEDGEEKESKPKTGGFASQMGTGKSGISGLQFERSDNDSNENLNFSSPVITPRNQTPIFATTNPLGMNNVSKAEMESYIEGN